MAELQFVEVVATGPGWNKVRASDGNVYTLKGDYNWRSNNPGNIEYGPFAISQGAIGSGAPPPGRKRGFAIFPTYEAGERARTVLQFESPSYRDKTIAQAISRYAPPSENNTQAYVREVTRAAGVTADTKMSDLTPQQRQAFLAAQRRVEGFRPGKIMGEAGKPVPASVVRQFSAKPIPAVNVGPAPVPATRPASVAAAQLATAPTYGAPPLPIRRPSLPTDRKPLPLPAPLDVSSPKTGRLPSGKSVEQGKVYRIGNTSFVGSVDSSGKGSLKKVDAGILKEAGKNTIVGGMVDAAVKELVGANAKPAAAGVARSAGRVATGTASKLAGAAGNLASGPSAALASALERLGRAAASKKAPVTLKDVAAPKGPTGRGRPASARQQASTTPSPAARLATRQGNVRTSGGIAGTVHLPHNVVPKSVLEAPAIKPAPKPTQAQLQAIRNVPKYLTKTRKVPIENEKKVAANNTLSAVPRGVVMNSLSRDSVAQKAAGAAAAKQLFRTETYQVLNPAYKELAVVPKAPPGPTPAQIEAARVAELRRIQAAYEAAQQQPNYLGGNTTGKSGPALTGVSKAYAPTGSNTIYSNPTKYGRTRSERQARASRRESLANFGEGGDGPN